MDSPKLYKRVYKDQNYSSKVLTGLSNLRHEGLLCDVTIHVEDSTYSCHRNVLATSCAYFQVMFTSQFKERDLSDITLEEIDTSAFNIILDFFYKGEIDIDTTSVCHIFKAAHILNCEDIQEYCKQFMLTHIRSETCLEYKQLADSYDLADIKRTVENYILKHFCKVYKTHHFPLLPLEDVCKFLSNDALRCHHEIEVFRAARDWLKNNDEFKGSEYVIMQHVRFVLMSSHDLQEIWKTKYMLNDEKCRQFLLNTMEYLADTNAQPVKSGTFAKPRGETRLIVTCGATKHEDGRYCGFQKEVISYHMPHDADSEYHQGIDDIEFPSLPSERFFSSAVARNNFIYVIGGVALSGDKRCTTATVYRYNCLDNHWTEMSSMKAARRSTASVILGEHILVVGGSDGKGSLSTVEMYDIAKDTWKYVKNFPYAVWQHASCDLNAKAYVSGGRVEPDNTASPRLHMYDEQSDVWVAKANLKEASYGHVMGGVGARIYVLGGITRTDEYRTTIEIFDTGTGQMTVSTVQGPRVLYAASIVSNTDMIICGGYWRATGMGNKIGIFKTEQNVWRDLPGRLKHPLTGLCAVIFTVPWKMIGECNEDEEEQEVRGGDIDG